MLLADDFSQSSSFLTYPLKSNFVEIEMISFDILRSFLCFSSGQTVYLVVAFPPPDTPSSCSAVVYCASGKCEETFSLISCIEQHKWNRWQGVLSRFICDPWALCAPNCFDDDNITSPDNFLMSICSLTAFSVRKKFKLYNTSELEKVFGKSNKSYINK